MGVDWPWWTYADSQAQPTWPEITRLFDAMNARIVDLEKRLALAEVALSLRDSKEPAANG